MPKTSPERDPVKAAEDMRLNRLGLGSKSTKEKAWAMPTLVPR